MQPVAEEILRHANIRERNHSGHQKHHHRAHDEREEQVEGIFRQFFHSGYFNGC